MAQAQKLGELKSSDLEKPDRKIQSFKGRFTLLISLLIAIIILLCIIIILLMTFNESNKNRYYNETNQKIKQNYNNSNEDINEFQSTVHQPQIPESSHKMIYRDNWGGMPPLYERPQKVPVKYVIISHTGGTECFTISSCSKQMKQIQKLHIDSGSPDIGYNFIIGGDANIYVARGWNNHNFHMNLDTIGICFIGNYIYGVLTPEMIKATQQLFKKGVEKGKLDKNYILVAHNQTYNTMSPGLNVYKQIKFWPHFSPDVLSDIDK